MSTDGVPSSFPLVSGGPAERLKLLAQIPAFALVIAGVGLSLASGVLAVICLGLAFLVFASSFLAWAGSRHGDGLVILYEAALHVRSTSDRQFGPWDHRYKWAHIASVEARSFSETGRLANMVAPIVGGRGGVRVVVLSLRESLVWPWRPPFGTDTKGIPSAFVKQVLLNAEDPDALATAARRYLSRK